MFYLNWTLNSSGITEAASYIVVCEKTVVLYSNVISTFARLESVNVVLSTHGNPNTPPIVLFV